MAGLSGSTPIGSGNPINQGGTGGAFQVQGSNVTANLASGLGRGINRMAQSGRGTLRGIGEGFFGLAHIKQEGANALALSAQEHEQSMQQSVLSHEQQKDINRQRSRIFRSNVRLTEPGTEFGFSHGDHTFTGTSRRPVEPTATAAIPKARKTPSSVSSKTAELTPAQKSAETRRRNREAAAKAAAQTAKNPRGK